MQKITPCLWFDTQAEEAAEFYVSLFENSNVGSVSRYDKALAEATGQPEGSAVIVPFELAGQGFLGLNGGPHFDFTPAISLFVHCGAGKEVDDLFAGLSNGGEILMPLQKYPFSDKYAWIHDRYGLSWQLFLGRPHGQKIAPSLMFVGEQGGKAEEAVRFYTALFEDAGVDDLTRYGKGEAPDIEGTVKYASFRLAGQRFTAMDSNQEHDFNFNEAVSFVVDCKDQKEVDYFWSRFTDGGEEAPCSWLKDRFGVSWQIVPTILPEMLRDKDPERARRVMQARLQMKKIDIATLQEASEGK